LHLLMSLRKCSRLVIWQQQLCEVQHILRRANLCLLCQHAAKGC
jgi:hypothetical protein